VGWNQALVFADAKEIKERSVRLGAGDDLYGLFAGVLTMRPWNKIVDQSFDHLNIPDTPEQRDELQVCMESFSFQCVLSIDFESVDVCTLSSMMTVAD
jgi:aarF domain-containing kinase